MRVRPTVTIGLPVYNGEAFLARALDSLLGQTFGDFEIIISDNASTDGTEAICRSYAATDLRIQYLRNPENLGAAENYNRVFRLASGRYFKWASHDDMCAPQFLERCVAALEADPDVVLCYPTTVIIDDNDKRLGEYPAETSYLDPRPQRRYRQWMIEREYGECNAVFGVIRASVLRKTGLIGKYMASDVVLLGELLLHGKMLKLPDPLFFRRDHANTSGRAHHGPNEILAWFDTSKKGRIHTPLWRWILEYSKVVFRTPLRVSERIRCLGLLTRWSLMIRNKLRRELVVATKRAFGRSAALPS